MADQDTLTPSDEELAAALAAVAHYLDEDTGTAWAAPPESAWRAAAALETQRLPAARNGAYARWASADRARRAEQWSYGITGL